MHPHKQNPFIHKHLPSYRTKAHSMIGIKAHFIVDSASKLVNSVADSCF